MEAEYWELRQGLGTLNLGDTQKRTDRGDQLEGGQLSCSDSKPNFLDSRA